MTTACDEPGPSASPSEPQVTPKFNTSTENSATLPQNGLRREESNYVGQFYPFWIHQCYPQSTKEGLH